MAKPKFNPVYYQNFTTNAKGELTYDNDTWNQINARNEAIQKIERANQLKLEIQTETNNLLAQYAKEKQGFETKAKIGKVAQFVADPRMWAKGVWEVGKMVTENPRDVFIGAPRGALQSKEATKLYEQSAALNNEATRLAQTDKAKSEELLRQSQELYKTAQEKYSKAVSNLGELTTGKQIAAKSALAGLDIGSFLPVGGAIKGGVAATQATSKLATKVPAAIQTTKLTGRANLLSNALGLGDIYQGTQVAIKQGLGEATEQTLRGQAARAAIQGPVYGTLEVLADEEQEDTLGNIVKSSFINGITASGLTLAFGWVGRALVSKVAPKAGTMPTPTPAKPQLLLPDPTRVYEGQVITPPDTRILPPNIDPTSLSLDEIKRRSLGLGVGEKLEPTQDPIKQSLGAFDPETTIPMLDLTKTVKGNNLDFNPDSALSVNSARKVVDDLALLNGKQVGGKSLQIDKNDPKYQEIYNNQIKPLIDRINAVDEVVEAPSVKVDPLIAEARKYKSADDFVKAKVNLYHGTSKDFKDFDITKLGSYTGAEDAQLGFHFTDNKEIADLFGIPEKTKRVSINTNKFLSWDNIVKDDKETFKNLYEIITGEKTPAIDSPEFDDIIEEFGFDIDFSWRDFKDELTNPQVMKRLQQKYEGIILPLTESDVLMAASQNVIPEGSEFIIFNPSKIQTEESLRQIYNKAQTVDEVAPVEVGDVSVAKKEKQSTEYKLKYNASNEQKELLSQYLNEKAKILFGEENIQLKKVKKEIAKKYFDTNPPSVVENKFKTFKEWYKNIDTNIFTNDIDERWNIYRGKRYDTFNELERAKESRYKEIVEKENPEDVEELINAYLDISRDVRRLEKPDPYNAGPNLSPKEIAFVKKIDKEVYEDNTLSELLSKEVGKKIETSEDLEKLSKKLGKEKVQELVDRFSKEASDKIDNAWQKFYKKNYKTSVEPQPQINKIPAEEVELEVNKIYNTLENEGFNIVPEKVVDTPAIDAVDDKLAKGDQPTAQEMDASMKELADTTGDPEVKAGVQQELNDRVKKSRFFERVKSANPEAIDPNASVFYEASRRAEDEKFADNLVINDFDKALEIASDINTKANPTGRDNLVVQKTIKKLIELGRNDEVNNITGNLSYKLTKSGDFIAATANSTIADPVSVILKQTQIRQSKFSKEIQTEVAKVKEQLNNVVIDKDAIIEILDNITCR